jgi:NAD(P)-dependent dehydrogenase (short-subunit alcohol dehydrogenase family)
MSAIIPKNWLITGTSSGFGRSLTHLLLERGDTVVATVRKADALSDLKAKYGNRLLVRVLDVTEAEAIRSAISAAFAELGRIDVVVSNAGYVLLGAAEELSDKQIARQVETNLIGSINLARAAIPLMRAQGGGRIIQISSSLGQAAYPTMSVYAATKWGIEGFFEGIIPEIANFGIDVTLVEPGASRTNFAGSSADVAAPLDVYDQTGAGEFRRMVAAAGEAMFRSDPMKVANAIIASVEQSPAPKRLTLGPDAYREIHAALTSRLSTLEGQRDIALSTEIDD